DGDEDEDTDDGDEDEDTDDGDEDEDTDGDGDSGDEDEEDGEGGEGDKDGSDGQEEAVSNGAGATATRQDEEPLFQGPESDEEMPLADHIEEMMQRLGIVFLVAGIATLIMYPSADVAINYFWSSHIPDPMVNRPRVYGPLEYILTKLKVAGIAGVVFGLPVFVYETYLFMRPGLYRKERRYYIAAIPTSLVLAAIGSLFAHFIVLPAIFAYFTAYTEGTAVIAFGLKETFNLIVILIAYMAVVFQIPLLIMLAIMMNLVTRQWLEDKRLLFWGGFLGLSWLVTPDPTGMAPIVVTLTMIGLYEGTLALLRWTGN
ncbi:MAG: twin-arginine translocase subunit TatC, partial [Halobacteriales archaeon]